MTLAIVEDHKIFAELLRKALLELDFIEAIDIYFNPLEFLKQLNIIKYDLLITDILMPEMQGIDLIVECRKKNNMDIIVLSTLTYTMSIKEAISAGANGFLAKEGSFDELIHAIKLVKNKVKNPYIGKALIDNLVQNSLFGEEVISLSPRQKRLLQLICEGNTVKEIADIEKLSVNTVNSYLQHLMHKLEVNRTPDLILKAIKIGLFRPPNDMDKRNSDLF